jgi:hypothetical protein
MGDESANYVCNSPQGIENKIDKWEQYIAAAFLPL